MIQQFYFLVYNQKNCKQVFKQISTHNVYNNTVPNSQNPNALQLINE